MKLNRETEIWFKPFILCRNITVKTMPQLRTKHNTLYVMYIFLCSSVVVSSANLFLLAKLCMLLAFYQKDITPWNTCNHFNLFVPEHTACVVFCQFPLQLLKKTKHPQL